MTRLFLSAAALLCLLAISTVPAAAASPDPPPDGDVPQQFVEMDEWVLNGHIRRPTATWVNSAERARFERLLRLQKSFMPALLNSGRHITR